jgi:hypothetical protein
MKQGNGTGSRWRSTWRSDEEKSDGHCSNAPIIRPIVSTHCVFTSSPLK